jgi:hypothetical protein
MRRYGAAPMWRGSGYRGGGNPAGYRHHSQISIATAPMIAPAMLPIANAATIHITTSGDGATPHGRSLPTGNAQALQRAVPMPLNMLLPRAGILGRCDDIYRIAALESSEALRLKTRR